MLSKIDYLRVDVAVRKLTKITHLSLASIDEMVARRHDLEHQLSIVRKSMKRAEILPYPFERAVTLLVKAKRFDEALEVARYVEKWSLDAERRWEPGFAKQWLCPKLSKIISRIPKLAG